MDGTYGTAMASMNPYVAWFSGVPGSAAWASIGFGWGDLEGTRRESALGGAEHTVGIRGRLRLR